MCPSMVRVLRGHYGEISDRPFNVCLRVETGPRDAALLESAMCHKQTSAAHGVRFKPAFASRLVEPIFHSFHVRFPTITIPVEMTFTEARRQIDRLLSSMGLAPQRRKAYSPPIAGT
jgi:glycine cleavage system protein P-like pyridoxal-binding family